MDFDYYTLKRLFETHSSIRLLRADNAPFVIAFLHDVFIKNNIHEIFHYQLLSRLDDFLYYLNNSEDEPRFSRNASAYLDEWSSDDRGWLRKYYRYGSDEACYDLSPASEKVLVWIGKLSRKHFIGTESRLNIIFDLLKQIAYGAETDTNARIAELKKQRDAINKEIDALERGEHVIADDAVLRDSYIQMESTARELLGDFREVEQNFRFLDRTVREKINSWSGNKGELIEEIFGDRDLILDSDQGRTFNAFWDFLMSPNSQEELTRLLENVFSIEAIQKLKPDNRIKRIHYDWLEAGEHTQRRVASLSQQLRRYLDNQVYLENRRVIQILESISSNSLKVRDMLPSGDFMSIDSMTADIDLYMERPLFSPPIEINFDSQITSAETGDIDTSQLYDQITVDKVMLRKNINTFLLEKGQVSLQEITQRYKLQCGAAELIVYLVIASEDENVIFDESVNETIEWEDDEGNIRRANCCRVVYCRGKS
ncbi:MAG TPA: DUF3375 domain-containing protein [Spirochaetota bacterium]|nr:DUF3375 domain-containing protein [Spirochaetota bacterium]